jgi:H+/Cl- antiporter ClcA
MILELVVTLLIIGFYSILIGGLFMSVNILKDGLQLKDPIVIFLGIAILTSMFGVIAFLTYVILETL